MLDALDAGLPSSTAWCPKRSDNQIQTLTASITEMEMKLE